MNPYEVIGVRRNSSAKTILKAYRRLAMEHHPDRNPGDEEAAARFEAVQRAYELLRDPARRKRYDETGDASEPRATQHPDAELMAVLGPCLSQVVDQLVEQGKRAESVDVVAAMREWLREAKSHRVKIRSKVGRMLTFYRETVARFRREGDDENCFASLARTQVQMLEAQDAQLEREVVLAGRCSDYLDRYGYDFERMIAGRQVPAYGAMSGSIGGWFTTVS